MKKVVLPCLLVVGLAACLPAYAQSGGPAAQEITAEVAVYGATASGVAAAAAAAREGHSVVLIEPSRWLGGLVGSGFRMSEDVPYYETIGGMARRFVEIDVSWGGWKLDWESKRNQALLKEMMSPYAERIRIVYEHRVRAVEKNGARIVSLLLEHAPPDRYGVPAPEALPGGLVRVSAKVFIDASYEGDVMAGAGVKHRVGRESKQEYGESLAGVRGVRRFPGIDPYIREGDRSSGLLPMIPPDPLGEPGSASRFFQGYNFKLAWRRAPTPDDPGILMPPPDPKDPLRYEFLRRIRKAGHGISWPTFNFNRGEVCTGAVPGAQADYPEGDWPTRSRVWRSYMEHLKSLADFTGKETRFPSDQNVDTGGWPHQLYVRSARRMLGRYVMTQADIALQTDTPDSVGMGYYPVDIYPCRLVVLDDGTLASEGDTFVLVSPGPYRIPYRSITPKAAECENLLVTVCMSASHVACASLRMEATYMVLGESAGVAAALALTEDKPVQEIDVSRLQDRLLACGQALAWNGKGYQYFRWNVWRTDFHTGLQGWWVAHPEEYPRFRPRPDEAVSPKSGIVVDDPQASRTGDWTPSARWRPFVGSGYIHDNREKKGTKSVIFRPSLPEAGMYEVRAAYTSGADRSRKVPVLIRHADGETRVLLDETSPPPIGGLFRSLGRYRFEKGEAGSVTISTEGTDDGYVVVDAVHFLRAADASAPPEQQ